MPQRYQLEHLSAAPAVEHYARPLLLLHGSWHGAWCWEAAMPDLARRGFRVHAMSLRGHGQSDRPPGYLLTRLDDYIADLATAIQALEPAPIVVAHSMGGFILQHYLMRYQLPGAILLASMPQTGALRFLLQLIRSQPGSAIQTLLTLNNLHLVGTPALARAHFFRPDISGGALVDNAARLVAEPPLITLDLALRLPKPQLNRTPLGIIAAERDAVFTVAEQQALAQAYQADYLLVAEAAHDLMLDPAWPQVADEIERLAARWQS